MQPRVSAARTVASQNRCPMTSWAAAGCGQTSQTPGSATATGEGVDVGAVMTATACLRRRAAGWGASDPAPTSEGCTRRTDTPTLRRAPLPPVDLATAPVRAG
jgi:hypothetical protein